MILICRAEDGQVFQLNATLWDIERTGSLELFLSQETGVEQAAILAYLSDGRRLRNENLREFSGAQDQSIFVFNKFYLDYDLDEVLNILRVEAPLQPPVEDAVAATPPLRPSQFAVQHVRTAHAHKEHVAAMLTSLRYQHEALRIASSSLDLNVLSIADAFEAFSSIAKRELDKQSDLLTNVEVDLAIIGRVKIHMDFMSVQVRKAVETGRSAPRTLGNYVDAGKMRQVTQTCANTYDDLHGRFEKVRVAMARLTEGSDDVRAVLNDVQLLENAEACHERSQDVFNKINEVAADVDINEGRLTELHQLDDALRQEVEFITDYKNAFTERCVLALRRISTLNTDIVEIPTALASLQADLRAKNSFVHIQRLHGMIYAYGATVVEVVRRKEFAAFFYRRAATILEVMARLSASEKKRRQIFRGEVHGQLPFETKGLDDPVPTIDFSPTGSVESVFTLERSDIDALLDLLDELERTTSSTGERSPISETRAALQKLIGKMDSMESAFERTVERSLLSASRLSHSRRRSLDIDETAFQQIAEQLDMANQAKLEQEHHFQHERTEAQVEIRQLRDDLARSQAAESEERERADALERELHALRAHTESETSARRTIERRHSGLVAEVASQQEELRRALADATEQTVAAERARHELAQVRAEIEEVRTLEANHGMKMVDLLEEQRATFKKLEDARSRGEDLEQQINNARAESEEVRRALEETGREKDRLLRAQASEHERKLRDHLAEADGDRAVLEHQLSEMRAVVEDCERQLKEAKADTEIALSDAVGLRQELQRVEHQLREARHAERVLRDDLSLGRTSQTLYEQRLEKQARLIAELLEVAIRFRDSQLKGLMALQTMTLPPTSSSSKPQQTNGGNMSGSMSASVPILRSPRSGLSPVVGPTIPGGGPVSLGALSMVEPSPIDPLDPAAALEQLREVDHDVFSEAIAKAANTIRKWQKQCKEYRERAKGKISFRNFAKGDLALFLPTRNSISKPWAAFNVSFPHYFLQATGHLAEQLKTREWIVARITSLTERVANHRDPASNPYGLGDGVKYYMLEVEDWTQPGPSQKRKPTGPLPRKGTTLSEPNANPTASAPTQRREATASPTMPTNGLSPSTSPPVGQGMAVRDGLVSVPIPEQDADTAEPLTVSPTSRLFPVRTRASSTPGAPSSLSRLLAQAGPSTSATAIGPGGTRSIIAPAPLETIPSARATPSPTISPTRTRNSTRIQTPPPAQLPAATQPSSAGSSSNAPNPQTQSNSLKTKSSGSLKKFPTSSGSSTAPAVAAGVTATTVSAIPSPLRSVSRTSRTSSPSRSHSRFSVNGPGGIGRTGTVPVQEKAAPTIALSVTGVASNGGGEVVTVSTSPASGLSAGGSTRSPLLPSSPTIEEGPVARRGSLNSLHVGTTYSRSGSPQHRRERDRRRSYFEARETPTPPSPTGSATDGVSSVFKSAAATRVSNHDRRRTTSYAEGGSAGAMTPTNAAPMTATSALASLASSWGVSFGRRKRSEVAAQVQAEQQQSVHDGGSHGSGRSGVNDADLATTVAGQGAGQRQSASDLLKQF